MCQIGFDKYLRSLNVVSSETENGKYHLCLCFSVDHFHILPSNRTSECTYVSEEFRNGST